LERPNYFKLHEFTILKSWPLDIDEHESMIFQRFLSELKNNLPKIVPYIVEFDIDTENVFDIDGTYLRTDFEATAIAEIPSFSSIKITWTGIFNWYEPASCKSAEIFLRYSCDTYSPWTGKSHSSYVEDWDIILVKAKEAYESEHRIARPQGR
jgi:hypothetical protein